MKQRNLAATRRAQRAVLDAVVGRSPRYYRTQALADLGVDVQVDVIDLRDHAHELTNMLLTGFAGPDLATAIDKVVKADGLIAATPIFSASTPVCSRRSSMCSSPMPWPASLLIAATAGTARHSLALEHVVRPLFSYLAVVVPTTVFAASEDWVRVVVRARPSERIDRAARELARLVASDQRPAPADPYGDVMSFEDLLGS